MITQGDPQTPIHWIAENSAYLISSHLISSHQIPNPQFIVRDSNYISIQTANEHTRFVDTLTHTHQSMHEQIRCDKAKMDFFVTNIYQSVSLIILEMWREDVMMYLLQEQDPWIINYIYESRNRYPTIEKKKNKFAVYCGNGDMSFLWVLDIRAVVVVGTHCITLYYITSERKEIHPHEF